MTIRVRLTAWYTAVLAVALLVAAVLTYAAVRRQLQRSLDGAMTSTARTLDAGLADEASENHGTLTARGAAELLAEFRESDRGIVLLRADGSEISAQTTPQARALDRALLRTRRGFSNVPGARLLVTPSATAVIAIAQSLAPQEATLAQLRRAMLITAPLALLVAALGGYVLARQSLAPVVRMSAKARAIGAENLSERIEAAEPRDELGELAATLNDLLARLDASFAAQRRFMADASHELRSPVAILQGELDVTLSRGDRDAADYRESLEVMRRSVQRLTRIVRDLFLLARTDAGEVPLNRAPLDLGELIAQTARAHKTLGDVTTECGGDLLVDGDEDLLQRMLGNLIENAIRHARGEEVRVRCTRDGASARIEVHDRGPGVDAALRGQIFERFVRADPARGAAAGSGAGLGLPIARWIAEAHGGKLRLESSGPEGSVFVATLPLVRLSAV
jgi:heavy metal sensor kinase